MNKQKGIRNGKAGMKMFSIPFTEKGYSKAALGTAAINRHNCLP